MSVSSSHLKINLKITYYCSFLYVTWVASFFSFIIENQTLFGIDVFLLFSTDACYGKM